MSIGDNLQTIGKQIRDAEQRYNRTPGSIRLLAVSKRHPVSALQEAMQHRQANFGENYAQEMQDKAEALSAEAPEWHFIGPIQSNKTRPIAALAQWVHTVDRLKLAQRFSEQRPEGLPPLNICIQVNISNEPSKSGVRPEDTLSLAKAIAILPNLQLRGLMAIPAPEKDFERQRAVFAQLRELRDDLNQHSLGLDTLSMGMSDDMEAAIAEGATIVRIGTAIFGQRPY